MVGINLGRDHEFARRFAALEQAVQQYLRMGVLNNGQLTSSGALYLNAGAGGGVVMNPATGQPVQVNGNLAVTGNQTVSGTKSFLMDHPTDPTLSLQHAATESPWNGVEYWGEGVLDDAGQAVVALPDYFEALCAWDQRLVMLTPRYVEPPPVTTTTTNPDGTTTTTTTPGTYTPPPLAASAIDNTTGAFTAYGPPGTPFWWHVKAVRQNLEADGTDSLRFEPVQPKFVPLPAAPAAVE
jgi:hypothetical protein